MKLRNFGITSTLALTIHSLTAAQASPPKPRPVQSCPPAAHEYLEYRMPFAAELSGLEGKPLSEVIARIQAIPKSAESILPLTHWTISCKANLTSFAMGDASPNAPIKIEGLLFCSPLIGVGPSGLPATDLTPAQWKTQLKDWIENTMSSEAGIALSPTGAPERFGAASGSNRKAMESAAGRGLNP